MIVCDATVSIVPLVLSSLSLALCSMADSKRLGKIAGVPIATQINRNAAVISWVGVILIPAAVAPHT